MTKNLWIWCLCNTLLMLLFFMAVGINNNIINTFDQRIEENKNQIEKIEYRLQNDSIVVNTNVYINYEKR